MNYSLYKIDYPEKVDVEEYDIAIVRNREQLELALDDCVNKKLFSFDYETGPTVEEKLTCLSLLKDCAETGNEEEFKSIQTRLNNSAFDAHRAEVAAISFAADVNTAYIMFLRMGSDREGYCIDMTPEEVFEVINEKIFTNTDIEKIAFNLEYETMMTTRYNCYIQAPVVDPFIAAVRLTQLCAYNKIVDPKRPSMGLGLKNLCEQILGVKMYEFTDLLENNDVSFYNELDPSDENVLEYSAQDCIIPIYLYNYYKAIGKQIPVDKEKGITYWDWLSNIEMPFMRITGSMRYYGFEWNSEYARKAEIEALAVQRQATDRIVEILNEIVDDYCTSLNDDPEELAYVQRFKDINPGKNGKNKIIKEFLFDFIQMPLAGKTDKGAPSMDAEALLDTIFMLENNLKTLNEEKYLIKDKDSPLYGNMKSLEIANRECVVSYQDKVLELVKTIQTVQKYSTLVSTHIVGRQKYLNPVTSRIHSSYTVWTETSRTASQKPNQQNVPAARNDPMKIRSLYRPAKDKVLILVDYSGFELRIMAYVSQDEVMINTINNGGDLHTLTAAVMNKKRPEDVTKLERFYGKAGNFGILYGGTEHALVSTLKKTGTRISLAEATNIVKAVKTAYPGIGKFQREIANFGARNRYVSTIYGYKRVLHLATSTVRHFREQAARQAANTPIQGSAADIMKRAQNRIYDYLAREGLKERINMIAQIHDEIVFECDNDVEFIKDIVPKIQRIMEDRPSEDFCVPVSTEVSIAEENWGTKVDYKDWLESKND